MTDASPNGVLTEAGSGSSNPGSAYVPDPVMIPTDIARDPTEWILLYDSDCGFCRWSLGWVLRADRRGVVRPVKLGTSSADELLSDLTPEQRMSSWHLVAPDGTRRSAGAAAPPLLRQLPGGRLPAQLLAAAPDMTERTYQWVVTHRSKFGKLIPEGSKRRADELIMSRARPPAAAR